MKIEVTCIEEHPDGSATANISIDSDGLRFLVNLGLVRAIEEALDNHKELEPYESPDSEVPSDGC